MVAGPKDEGNSRALRSALSPNHAVRSSTWPASTQLFRPPPPQPQMMVGPWPAPSAVLILVLYGSFWYAVALIWLFGLALLNRSTECCRMSCCGWPLRNQYVVPPPDPPPP